MYATVSNYCRIIVLNNAIVRAIDPRPKNGTWDFFSNLDPVPEGEGWFQQTSYKGAFGDDLWLKGWSWLDYGHLGNAKHKKKSHWGTFFMVVFFLGSFGGLGYLGYKRGWTIHTVLDALDACKEFVLTKYGMKVTRCSLIQCTKCNTN